MKTLKSLLFPKDMLLICCLLTWGWVRGRRGRGGEKRHSFTIGESFNIKPVHFCRCVWVVQFISKTEMKLIIGSMYQFFCPRIVNIGNLFIFQLKSYFSCLVNFLFYCLTGGLGLVISNDGFLRNQIVKDFQDSFIQKIFFYLYMFIYVLFRIFLCFFLCKKASSNPNLGARIPPQLIFPYNPEIK